MTKRRSPVQKKVKIEIPSLPSDDQLNQFTKLAAEEKKELLQRFSFHSGFCEICQKSVCQMFIHYKEKHAKFKNVTQCLEPKCSKLMSYRKDDLFRHMKSVHGWSRLKSAEVFEECGQQFSIPRRVWQKYKYGDGLSFEDESCPTTDDRPQIDQSFSALSTNDVVFDNTTSVVYSGESIEQNTQYDGCQDMVYTELGRLEMISPVAGPSTEFPPPLQNPEPVLSEDGMAGSALNETQSSVVDQNVNAELELQSHCNFIRKLIANYQNFDFMNATLQDLFGAVAALELDLHQMETILFTWLEKMNITHKRLLIARNLLMNKRA